MMRSVVIAIGAGGLVIAGGAALGAPGPAPAVDGAMLFQQRCAVCHSIVAGKNGAGPSLAKVEGRKAGSVPGFAYSPALKASGLTWDGAKLDHYLENPQAAVPGTRMPVAIADPAQRTAIVRYLTRL